MSLCVRRLVFEHPFVNIECLALRLWIKGGVLLVKSSQVQISARELRRPLQSLPETLFRTHGVGFRRFNLLGVVEAQEASYGGPDKSFRQALKTAPKITRAYL